MMSEADVIRGHIISDAEAIDGEWGCVHEWADMTPKCAGYADAVAALAALDSLTTRLAAVERARDELDRDLHGTGGVIDSLAEAYERLAAVERERDGLRGSLDEWKDDFKAVLHMNAALREQLTRARELLERVADKLDAVHEASSGIFVLAATHGWAYTGPTYEQELKAIRQALATMEAKDE